MAFNGVLVFLVCAAFMMFFIKNNKEPAQPSRPTVPSPTVPSKDYPAAGNEKKGFYNDFKHGIEYAGWKHDGSDNWARHKNRYNVDDLGERYSAGSDYYMYVATSGSKSGGYLRSPEIPANWDDACLTFTYYISNGDSNQRINIDHGVNILSKDVDYSRQWKLASVPINIVGVSKTSLLIGGVASGDGGQIVAIDDLHLFEGACPKMKKEEL